MAQNKIRNTKLKPTSQPLTEPPPVKTILISQPAPDSGKSPYYDLGEKHNIKVDFRQFIHVEEIPAREFRKQRVYPHDFSAVIFNSRNAIDHFFRICEEMRIRMSQETRFFCISEAIALYLQKYTEYRKRKVNYGSGSTSDLFKLLKKYKKNETFLYPCSDKHKDEIPAFLEENGFNYSKAIIYRTVCSDLSDLKNIFYDMIVFFSPSGIESLFQNFPDFTQNQTRLAGFGSTTQQAIADYGLRLDVEAPVPEAPSMTSAIELYLKKVNK